MLNESPLVGSSDRPWLRSVAREDLQNSVWIDPGNDRAGSEALHSTQNVKEYKMDIAQGPIGTVGAYEIDIVGGKLVLKATAAASPVEAGLDVKVDLAVIKDLIKAKIPGTIDDAILELLFGALVAV